MTALVDVPLDLDRWRVDPARAVRAEHLGRRCLRFAADAGNPTVVGLELTDGVIEADLAIDRNRAFHGLVWRVRGEDPDRLDAETFYVRPHQLGNPDSIQYTPVSNGISSWQLYHGPGYWEAVTFPIEAWFTLRVAFTGHRADAFIDDMARPILAAPLVHPPSPGGVGLLVGGEGLHVARFAVAAGRPVLPGTLPPQPAPELRAILDWQVSEPFPEAALDRVTALPTSLLSELAWQRAAATSSGLLDLGRLHGIRDGRNTVLARAAVPAPAAEIRALEVGFSDRAIVFLNGRPLFRGDDGYRTRDYRFLGSIGWWDRVYLPLEAGENELVVAVSEDFGGWGVQARFAD